MRSIASALVFALALSAPAASAQTAKPDVSGAPSAQNSGAGIAGQPGETVGNSSSSNQQNPTVQQQDTSNITGLPGNKSGPPAKEPDRK